MSYLRATRIRNFKAIRDTGTLKFGPLTVFIGNNGAGKSSVLEALETYQQVVLSGVDEALGRFNGIEHVRNKSAKARRLKQSVADPQEADIPIRYYFRASIPGLGSTRVTMRLNARGGGLQYIQSEDVAFRGELIGRDFKGAAKTYGEGRSIVNPLGSTRVLYESVQHWQFIALHPDVMGQARPQQRVKGRVLLARDGSNLAGYVLDLAERAPDAFNGVVDAMRFVLPYMKDIRPVLPSTEIDRRVFLELAEKNFRIPGWMLSSGTLRLLAILALLRDPQPPPVLFIEELENGLDPRTIGMLVEEIRSAVTEKRTQVIATTHSPYLLDQLTFDHVIVVERNESGDAEFWRPSDEESLKSWYEKFSLGQIYTMGQLRREPKKASKPARAPRPRKHP
jgi:predicted ATPase